MKSTRTPIRTDIGKSIENISSETLLFYKIDTGLIDAGEAAGTVVAGVLAKSPILTKIGDREGTYDPADKFASSISFTTGVMDSIKEIGFIYDGDSNQRITLTKALLEAQTGNGWWACDYFTGLILVKKLTTGVSQIITSYKVRAGSSGATSGLSYNAVANADKVQVINQLPRQTILLQRDVTATSVAFDEYIDVEGLKTIGVQATITSGTVTITLEATMENNGTAPASCDFVDITQFGTTRTNAAAAATLTTGKGAYLINNPGYKYVKIKVASPTSFVGSLYANAIN